ncbi:hypothetical protein [Bradyrhizobium sp. CCBAU 51753]|nr:hypothetical protein [Bradyrhizobium sp. CCBAU 51753]
MAVMAVECKQWRSKPSRYGELGESLIDPMLVAHSRAFQQLVV